MDTSHLNDKQQEAVTHEPHHILVLAGAGSGKTRVLVHRLAWLFEQHGVSPHEVLAVTFTNKAANEMRERIGSLCQVNPAGLWIGTFHGIAHKFLRLHATDAGLSTNFQVIDSDDQRRLLRRTLKELGLDEKAWEPKKIQNMINSHKNNARRPEHLERKSSYDATLADIYQRYERNRKQSDLVDFAELLLLAYETLKKQPQVLQHYQQRFRHVLVDEFQDTNDIQYMWLKLLSHQKNHFMVVGDDDQSIYGWRGAKIENIRKFQKDYSPSKIIRLEQNYRSTQNILDAANAVIARNPSRLGKKLWTDRAKGELLQHYEAYNEIEEAQFITSTLRKHVHNGFKYSDIAVLYRSNAQSRVLEEAMLSTGIPYRIYGGFRFFDRAEIKNALAYLSLVHAKTNDAALERVINVPVRGIGPSSLAALRQLARDKNCSLWDAMNLAITERLLPTKSINSFAGFMQIISDIQKECEGKSLAAQADIAIKNSKLISFYEKEPGERAKNRIENLNELVSAAEEFIPSGEDGITPLAEFLTHAALESGEIQADKNQNSVQLMTLHSAKGLEFPIVFLSGMEDELFPSAMAIREGEDRLEEERRLCYVGMTRAQKHLILTNAHQRRIYGKVAPHKPSRFLNEIPQQHINKVELANKISRPLILKTTKFVSTQPKFSAPATPNKKLMAHQVSGTDYRIGQRIRHAKFGDGVIINYEGSGEQARLEIQFVRSGLKRLVAKYARLENI